MSGDHADAVEFTNRLKNFLASPPPGNFLEFERNWWTGTEVAAAGRQIDLLLRQAGVPDDAAIGVLVRNRVGHAAVLLGLVGSNRSVVSLSTLLSDGMIADDIRQLRLGAIVAEEQDWTDALRETLRDGRVGISFPTAGVTPSLVPGSDLRLAEPATTDRQYVAVLTSGTTGAPKRIELHAGALARGREIVTGIYPGMAGHQVEIQIHHFSSIGGILQLLCYGADRFPFCLLEKFEVEEWVAAIDRHQAKVISAGAPMIRSLLAADLPPGSLTSAEVLHGGGGAIEPEVLEECERRFNVQVCWAFGATEFAGTLASWTRDLKTEFGNSKRGSCGRVLPDCEVRITDRDTGELLPAGEEGRLEALIPVMSSEWIRTNDLARLDEDGFLYVLGRMDGAINRGGFKVLPNAVASALRRHPAVVDAVVFALPDQRLGEVPVAAVEAKPGSSVTGEELRTFCRQHMAVTSVPAEIRVYERLPRQTLKVDMPRLREDWAKNDAG
jgi:acyl-CoA synthetase (AMP-forming)/AMP-acid ligase II